VKVSRGKCVSFRERERPGVFLGGGGGGGGGGGVKEDYRGFQGLASCILLCFYLYASLPTPTIIVGPSYNINLY